MSATKREFFYQRTFATKPIPLPIPLFLCFPNAIRERSPRLRLTQLFRVTAIRPLQFSQQALWLGPADATNGIRGSLIDSCTKPNCGDNEKAVNLAG